MLKNVLLATALSLSVYAVATSAQAGHRPQGWYIGLEAGMNWKADADVETNVIVLPLNKIKFDEGPAFFVDLGYRWENNWRVEFEVGHRGNDVDCFRHPVTGCKPGALGDISQLSQMVNVVHDIEVDERTAVSIGLGLGGNYIDIDSPGFTHDDDYVFSAQAILAVSHELAKGIDLTLTYRFLTSDDAEFKFNLVTPVEMENESHTVTIGLRFDLEPDAIMAEPQPVVNSAPPPQVAPPAPKQFIVYFGFNKSNLSASARQVVKEAAATAMHDGYVQILVTGHTDTVGSSTYNKRLSARRAGIVKNALVSEGIPAKGITSEGKGETMLMVQTGDHEMEGRNRRAEINLN